MVLFHFHRYVPPRAYLYEHTHSVSTASWTRLGCIGRIFFHKLIYFEIKIRREVKTNHSGDWLEFSHLISAAELKTIIRHIIMRRMAGLWNETNHKHRLIILLYYSCMNVTKFIYNNFLYSLYIEQAKN